MKKIEIKESQGILTKMGMVINEICECHHIPFIMVAGTMLGAIRHKGFIPWDDDMDFAVPYEYYEKLINILEKELPYPYKCITFENSEVMLSSFFKVEDTSTLVDEPIYDLVNGGSPGISIDVFPLVKCKKEEVYGLIKKIRNVYMLKRRVFIGSTDRKWYKKYIKILLKKIVPFSALSLNRKTQKLMDQIEPGDFVSIPVSPHYWEKIYPKNWFESIRRYKFGDVEFWGPADYDSYLRMLYGDYMKMPPKEKQIVHNTNVYLK
jgi:lipopolysaccharide cholinephosphotransferase